MRYAQVAADDRVTATRGARASCPICNNAVLAKCGPLVADHWAHISLDDCDTWAEPQTEWHRGWQDEVPSDRREIVIGAHRADIVRPDDSVVELQTKALPSEQVQARENHYGPRMTWIIDAREPFSTDRLNLRKREYGWSFRWKHPRKWVSLCERRCLLDLGDGLVLLLQRINIEAPCGGWGHLLNRSQVTRWLNGGGLPVPLSKSTKRTTRLAPKPPAPPVSPPAPPKVPQFIARKPFRFTVPGEELYGVIRSIRPTITRYGERTTIDIDDEARGPLALLIGHTQLIRGLLEGTNQEKRPIRKGDRVYIRFDGPQAFGNGKTIYNYAINVSAEKVA